MKLGNYEILLNNIQIINPVKQQLPFNNISTKKLNEDTKLKYRYLDHRHDDLHKTIETRSNITFLIHQILHQEDFIEIETPILCRSSPEGANEFIVPFGNNSDNYYSLSQSPQQYKQLLMIGGYRKYYQMTRCFRNEKLRNDRQNEFTQLDLEMSFINENDIYDIVEKILKNIFTSLDIEYINPVKLKYNEVINKYGSDKPDLRYSNINIKKFPDNLIDFSTIPFFNKLTEDMNINYIKIDELMKFQSKSQLKEITKDLKPLTFITKHNNKLSGTIMKNIKPEEQRKIISTLGIVYNI